LATIFVKHKDIDPAKWDNCIVTAANKKIYGLYNYLNIACEWDAIVYNDYEAVMPLPHKTRLGVAYLYQPFFCQQLGVFHSITFDFKNYLKILSVATKLYKYGQIQLNHLNKLEDYGISIEKKNIIRPKTNHILNLAEGYDIIYKKFSSKCKQSIKKGQSTASNISLQCDMKTAMSFYENNYGKRTPHVQLPDFERLSALLQLKELEQEVYIYHNPNSKEIEAISIFVLRGNQIYYMLSAVIAEAKQNCALFYIMDAVIKKYAGKNYILDFEGSIIPSLARFNLGFGAIEQIYFDLRFSSNFSILGRRMLAKGN